MSSERPARPLRARLLRLAAPAALATAVTGGAVTLGVSQAGVASGDAASTAAIAAAARSDAQASARRMASLDVRALNASRVGSASRSASRVTLDPEVTDRKWATADLNLRLAPSDRSKVARVVDAGTRLGVTGQRQGRWAEVLVKGSVRWVNATYLDDTKPEPPAGEAAVSGISSAPCPDGSGTESGLTPSAVRLFRAVCAAFPALGSYGGWDAHGEHTSGRAIDFMTSDPVLGQAVADWVRAHAAELDVFDVIWAQHIWTPVRAGEGWRAMGDRGSATANHYDHVHVAVN